MIQHLNREFETNRLCYRALHHKGPLYVNGIKLAGETGEGVDSGQPGLYVQKVALAVYDFAVDGGTAGAITLRGTAQLPDNAVVTAITYDVLTTCTSATDAATIARC